MSVLKIILLSLLPFVSFGISWLFCRWWFPTFDEQARKMDKEYYLPRLRKED